MTNRAELDALIEVVRPLMSQRGFQRKEMTWYRYSSETVQLFDIQLAATQLNSERIYFNLGVTLRSSNPPTHLAIFDCSLYGRLDRLVPKCEDLSTLTNFADPTNSLEHRVGKLAEIINRFASPVLDLWQTTDGLRVFIKGASSKGFVKKLDQLAPVVAK